MSFLFFGPVRSWGPHVWVLCSRTLRCSTAPLGDISWYAQFVHLFYFIFSFRFLIFYIGWGRKKKKSTSGNTNIIQIFKISSGQNKAIKTRASINNRKSRTYKDTGSEGEGGRGRRETGRGGWGRGEGWHGKACGGETLPTLKNFKKKQCR